MKIAQEEIFEESGRRFKPWCANGKSLRMGEIILIIDSDTVVPEDCFRDAAREMGVSGCDYHWARIWYDWFFPEWKNLAYIDVFFFRCDASCPSLFRKRYYIFHVASTNVSLWAVLTGKWLLSLDIMPFFDGQLCKMRLSSIRRMVKGNNGRKRTFWKISIWHWGCFCMDIRWDGRLIHLEGLKRVCLWRLWMVAEVCIWSEVLFFFSFGLSFLFWICILILILCLKPVAPTPHPFSLPAICCAHPPPVLAAPHPFSLPPTHIQLPLTCFSCPSPVLADCHLLRPPLTCFRCLPSVAPTPHLF